MVPQAQAEIRLDCGPEVDVEAEQADVKTLEKAAKVEKKTGLAATETELKGRCGPQTKIHLPLTDDAASWSDPFPANKKHPIGRYDVKQAKICGPGTFTFSPTSCGRMDYKPDIFEVSNKESGDCKVVDLNWGGGAVSNLSGQFELVCHFAVNLTEIYET